MLYYYIIQPLSQELLAAQIKLLKIKSKSVETSPISTPHRSRHPIWQLSLRGTAKTESDSSGNTSPVLLSRAVTPTPTSHPPPSTTSTTGPSSSQSHHHTSTVSSDIPHVTVTTTDSVTGTQSTSFASHNSTDTPFTDATDGNSNLKSDNKLNGSNSNLNTDSVSTSDSIHHEVMGSSNSSDTESNYSEHQTPRKFARKSRSSPVSGEPLLERSEEDTGSAVKIPNSDIDPVMDSATVGGRLRTRTSILSQILELHPTRIGLWRLQKGVCVCVCVLYMNE